MKVDDAGRALGVVIALGHTLQEMLNRGPKAQLELAQNADKHFRVLKGLFSEVADLPPLPYLPSSEARCRTPHL